MDSPLELALSAKSSPASLLAASSVSEIALADSRKQSEGLPNSVTPLSPRERAIVFLMGHGLTNKMIARKLGIAPDTVKAHAKNIFWKLTAQTRAQAVYRASELGLI